MSYVFKSPHVLLLGLLAKIKYISPQIFNVRINDYHPTATIVIVIDAPIGNPPLKHN